MVDSQRRGFRLWPRREKTVIANAPGSSPTAQELCEKMVELVHFERGIATLYYYRPDEALTTLAQTLSQAYQSQNLLEQGVDRELRHRDAALESWTAVSAIWRSDVWQPGEILATFGFRIIEDLRAQPEVWSVIEDPHAQFFGLAITKSEEHRYWLVVVTGRKGEGSAADSPTAAR